MRVTAVLSLACVLAVAGCGGGGTDQGTTPPAGQTAGAGGPQLETRWLRGLWDSDIRKVLPKERITCEGPKKEGLSTVWGCEWGTPLNSYKVRYYGAAPGKIEYIIATVTQADQPKDDRVLPLFTDLAGLHFEGAEPAKAREWIRTTLAGGGNTAFGAARFKLAGDVVKRTLEIKASGSEW